MVRVVATNYSLKLCMLLPLEVMLTPSVRLKHQSLLSPKMNEKFLSTELTFSPSVDTGLKCGCKASQSCMLHQIPGGMDQHCWQAGVLYRVEGKEVPRWQRNSPVAEKSPDGREMPSSSPLMHYDGSYIHATRMVPKHNTMSHRHKL